MSQILEDLPRSKQRMHYGIISLITTKREYDKHEKATVLQLTHKYPALVNITIDDNKRVETYTVDYPLSVA